MKISRVGVDLAKNVFQLHGVDRNGETVLKRRLSRDKMPIGEEESIPLLSGKKVVFRYRVKTLAN